MSSTSSSGVSSNSSSIGVGGIGGGGGGATQRRGRVTTNIAPTTVLVVDDETNMMSSGQQQQQDQQQQEGLLSSSPSKNKNTDNYMNHNITNELTTTYNNNMNNPVVLKPIPVQSLAAGSAVSTPTTPNKQLTTSFGSGGGGSTGTNTNLTISNGNGTISNSNTNTITGPIRVAVVKRNFVGTGPFDYHWLNVDCCGLFCALLTYSLHCYGMYVVCFIIIPPWMSNNNTNTNLQSIALSSSSNIMTTPTTETNNNNNEYRNLSFFGLINTLLFTTLTSLAVIAHFKAMTTDPGAVPPDAKPVIKSTSVDDNDDSNNNDNNLNINTNNKTVRICRKCHTFKPQRAHHCSICKRCIIKMDHHCPWVNNCVGIGNHKYFLLFIFYTCITCMYSLSLIIIRLTTCVHSYHHHKHYHYKHVYKYTVADAAMEATDLSSGKTHCLDYPTQLLYILGLLVEAILFGMFTSCMIFDQADVIRTNMSHIDRFKYGGNSTGNDKLSNTLSGVAEVFGLALSKVTSNSKNNKYKRSTSSTIVGRFLSLFSTTSNTTTINNKSIDGNDSDDNNCDSSPLDSSTLLFDNNSQQDSIERGNSSIRQKRPKNQNQQQHTVSFRFDWLSPFAKAVFPPSVRDEMMGFCRPCLPRRPKSFYDDTNNNSTSTSGGTGSSTGGDFELAGANIINSPKNRTNNHRSIRNVSEIL